MTERLPHSPCGRTDHHDAHEFEVYCRPFWCPGFTPAASVPSMSVEEAEARLAPLEDAVRATDRNDLLARTVRACAEHLRDRYADTWTADAARSLDLIAARIERGEPTALLRRLAELEQHAPDGS